MSYTFDNGNTTPPSSGDRHTPVLNGDVFCSPACGFKCKLADFEKATAGAAALVAALGDGWSPRVWENCNWHFSAQKGSATVDFNERKGNFSADIIATDARGERQQFRADGSTPRDAMQNALSMIEVKISALKRTMLSASLEPLAIKAD